MGEGWGEGEYNAISTAYIPLPFIPSRQGRGNLTFYEFIKIDTLTLSNKSSKIEFRVLFRVFVLSCFAAYALKKDVINLLRGKNKLLLFLADSAYSAGFNIAWFRHFTLQRLFVLHL